MRKLLFLALLCPFLSMCQPISLKGKIINEQHQPLAGATVTVKRVTNDAARVTSTATNGAGEFSITRLGIGDTIIVTAVGYEPHTEYYDYTLTKESTVTIMLTRKVSMLDEVIVNTGYQRLPKERATGSFNIIDASLLNRSTAPGILDRIENLAPGLLFNKADNQINDPFTIRGRSTLFASSQPLIVLDNFAYDGDLDAINPSDVENITILKDAAAASIWGARAGNGVIVITTKHGTSSKPRVEFNTSFTTQPSPNLFSLPVISSADYIGLEQFLFSKGYYNSLPTANGHPPITPAVEWMLAQAAGTVSPAQANAAIDALKAFDFRKDVADYLYQPATNQRYSVSLSGNNGSYGYYLSAGYDRNISNEVGTNYNRFIIRSSNTVRLTSRLTAEAALQFTTQDAHSGANSGYAFLNNGFGKGPYPYARLVDERGIPIPFLKDFRASFAEAPGPVLLPWQYNPISDNDEVNNKNQRRDYMVNLALTYKLLPSLSAVVQYQYALGLSSVENNYSVNSWFARNLINQYTQVSSAGTITTPIPVGGIIDHSTVNTGSHQARAQFNFNRVAAQHTIALLAGMEVKQLASAANTFRLYGFNSNASAITTNIDYSSRFSRFDNNFSSATIPNPASVSGNEDRFVSYYTNGAYTYKERYVLSVSARQDASNLFGVKSNQQAVPLWSTGLAWHLHDEPFYNIGWLERLTLRTTYGAQGNISRRTSAYTTARFSVSPATHAVTATIQNPPNEKLKWEKVRMLNLGLDFTLKNNRLSGTIEYYWKNATDLMGVAPVDPTWGLAGVGGASEYFGNVAAMKGQGLDVELNAAVLKTSVTWNINLNGSYASNQVTKYAMPASTLGMSYLLESTVNPVVGRSLFAVYSYPWQGLDPTNGNPQGLVNGKTSSDYISIITKTNLDSMVYNGTITPTVFGALRNNVTWKQLTLSFLISYKLGYYYRRGSIHYSNLFNTWTGHSDYSLRWQQPGDEKTTGVPSLIYPANALRDRFYTNAAVLVDKADHIRFEDVNLSYTFKTNTRKLPLNSLRVFIYASNLGLLWTANDHQVDPYFTHSPRTKASWAIGLSAIF